MPKTAASTIRSRETSAIHLIYIAERWRDPEALGAHGKSAHMRTFNQAMGGVTREGADLWLYSAEEVRKLM